MTIPTNTRKKMKKSANTQILKALVGLVFFLGLTSNTYVHGQCFGATAPEMSFTSSGGSIQVTIQHSCSGGTFSIGTYPSWLTSIPTISGNTVTAVAPAYSGQERNGNIVLLYNGSTAGGIAVVQNDGVPPPPPPCSITGFNGSNFIGAGETKSYTLTYSNCPSNIYYTFKQVVNSVEQNLPTWVTISQPSPTQVNVTFAQNSGTTSRNVTIIGKRQDGGSPGIGGTFTQSCFEKDWYLDSDGDNFRDPGSTVVKDCASSKPGYTQSTTVDVCPNDYNLGNVSKTFYADSDGDGFRDPGGATLTQCSTPTGNWTESTIDDLCPDQPYSSNQGCDPNCSANDVSLSKNLITFGTAGGTDASVVNFPNGCTLPYEITLDLTETWLSWTITNNNQINITCQALANGTREVSIPVRVNGSVIEGILVKQNAPPTPPATCEITASDDIVLDALGDTTSFTVTFTPSNCETPFTLKHPYEPSIPSWLQVTNNGNSYTLTVGNNANGELNTTQLIAVKNDGTASSAVFNVSQPNCNILWYPDSDNDGSGDPYGNSVMQCADPDDEVNDDPNTFWVDNNDDACPELYGLPANQGCPGAVPENWNTITTRSYDVSQTLKVAGKSYFDELGQLRQTQSWDVKSDSTWAVENMYDNFGRQALTTLGAPIRTGSDFEYKEGFVKAGNNTTDYVLNTVDPGLTNINGVGDVASTLGWYYSENNDHEDYQDVTDYPFSRQIFSKLNPGGVLQRGTGNKINGEWPQAYTFSVPASQELSQTVAFGNVAYDTIRVIKTISRNPHGEENVVFVDSEGKTLAAARSGGTQVRNVTINIGEQGLVDIHLPQGTTGISTANTGTHSIKVHNLITEDEYTASLGNLPPGFYRVSIADWNPDDHDPNQEVTVTYPENYYDYSLNEYDRADRLIASYQPIGATKAEKPKSIFEYDASGRMVHSKSPDEGDAWFRYREDGQIRFSQNSKQKNEASPEEFSYTSYDVYGRPTESGVVESAAFATEALGGTGSPTGTKKEVLTTTYDFVESTELASLPTGYQNPGFLSGNVAKTENENTTTYYSYDVYGRVKWMVQDIVGIGYKTIDYEYEPVTGLVTRVLYQKDNLSERFIHRYTYNEIDELIKVETSMDDVAYTVDADYEYYETGQLKRTELAGIQGVDYVYGLSGQLKGINHPSLDGLKDPGGDTNDLFGMQMDYHSADYQRAVTNIKSTTYGTDRLDGNLKGTRWNNDQNLVNGVENVYSYTYERNNWLTDALYGTYNENASSGLNPTETDTGTYTSANGSVEKKATTSVTLLPNFHAQQGSDYTARIVPTDGFSPVGNGDYNVTGIEYDANGNIQRLNRKKDALNGNNDMDDLVYKYNTVANDPTLTEDRPNQLLRVEDGSGDVAGAEDIGTQSGSNYVYNQIGQLVEDHEHATPSDTGDIIRYEYNTSGLVTRVTRKNVPLVKFFYNDRNQRVKKQSFNGTGVVVGTTYYARSATGSVMGIYQSVNGGAVTLAEHPIWGNGRIGVLKRTGSSSGTAYYELNDHLGNVRAVFSKNNGQPANKDYNDYYPFGMQMPARNSIDANNYRYAFQGQEKDPETGKEAFELRLWDSRIGRWLTTDPYGQYNSPYMGMGNNPINGIDPDGGCFTTDKDGNTIPCPTMDIGSTTTGAAGYEWTMQDDGWTRSDGYGVTVTGQFKLGPNTPLWDFSEQLQLFRDNTKSIIADGGIPSAYSIQGYLDSFEHNALMDGRNHVNFQDIQDVQDARGDAALMILPIGRLGSAFNAFRGYRSALAIGKGGLSVAGRALQKHPNIARVVTSSTITTNALRNSYGAKALKHIMRNGAQTTKHTKAFGNVIDFKLPSGLGARFSAETNQFITFLGRGL